MCYFSVLRDYRRPHAAFTAQLPSFHAVPAVSKYPMGKSMFSLRTVRFQTITPAHAAGEGTAHFSFPMRSLPLWQAGSSVFAWIQQMSFGRKRLLVGLGSSEKRSSFSEISANLHLYGSVPVLVVCLVCSCFCFRCGR